MTVMTSKHLYAATKRDDGMSYLMNKFGFSEEEELFEAIRKVSPSNADDFISKLQKKQKKFAQRAKNHEEVAVGNESDIQPELIVQTCEEIINEEPEQEEDVISAVDEKSDEETESNEEDSPEIPTLEQLLAKEKELSSKICDIEGEHKALVGKRREVVSRLERCQNALRELKRLLHAQEENVTKAYEEFLGYATQMEALNGEKKVYEKQLDVIRQKIDDMRKVNIFVYENASFEVENVPIEPIADSEITAQSIQLFALPEAEELTAKEIKNIAKLQMVVELIESNGYKVELVFDSTRVQSFWETVIAQN